MLGDENFWVLIAFIAFFALIAYLGIHKKILGGLDARADRIRAQLEEAEHLREEARAALAEAERKQRDAQSEAEAMIERARKDAETLKADAERKLQETLARREASAHAKIEQAEARALSDVRAAAAQIAVAAAEKLIADNLTGKADAGLVDATIADIPKRLAH